MTYEKLCERLAPWLSHFTGRQWTPRQVWEISPTGELWPIHVLAEQYGEDIAEGRWPIEAGGNEA